MLTTIPVTSSSVQPEIHPAKSIKDLTCSANQEDAITGKPQPCDTILQVIPTEAAVSLPAALPYNDTVAVITSCAQGPVRLTTMRDCSGYLLHLTAIEQEPRLLSLSSIGDVSVIVRHAHREKGRIIVSDRHLPAETIQKALADQGVIHVKRCGFRSNSRFVPKETVILTFDHGLQTPKQLLMGSDTFDVLPYATQAPQCYKCGRVGHVSKYCFSNTTRCYRCGGAHLKEACKSDHPICQLCQRHHETMKCPSRLPRNHSPQLSVIAPSNMTASSETTPLQENSAESTTSSNVSSSSIEANTLTPTHTDAQTQTDFEADQSTARDDQSSLVGTHDAVVQTDLFSPCLTEDEDDLLRNEVLHGIIYLFGYSCAEEKEGEADAPLQRLFQHAYTILRQSNDWFNSSESVDQMKTETILGRSLTQQQAQLFDKRYTKLKDNFFLADVPSHLSQLFRPKTAFDPP
jgi:hypothetical protein